MDGMTKAKEGCVSRCEEILMEFIAFKYKAKTLEYVKNLILHDEPLKVTSDLHLTYCKDIVDDINAIDFPSYIDFNKEGIKIYNKNLALQWVEMITTTLEEVDGDYNITHMSQSGVQQLCFEMCYLDNLV